MARRETDIDTDPSLKGWFGHWQDFEWLDAAFKFITFSVKTSKTLQKTCIPYPLILRTFPDERVIVLMTAYAGISLFNILTWTEESDIPCISMSHSERSVLPTGAQKSHLMA